MLMLVNPPERSSRTMATRRRRRRAAPRTSARRAPARRRAAPARRRATARRRNPDLTRKLTSGVRDAGLMLAGEAATRAIPQAIGLPQGGATGTLAQVATAVGVGMVADRMLSPSRGAMVLAGALAVPIRDAVARAGIPGLSPALTADPTPLAAGSYARRIAPRAPAQLSAGSYARPAVRPAVSLGAGSYAAAPGYAPYHH